MRARLVAGYLLIAAFVLVVLGIPFVRTTIDRERAELRVGIERDAVVLGSAVEDVLTAGVTAATRETADSVVRGYHDATGARVVITDANGTAVADNDPPAPGERSFRTRPEMAAALAGRVGVDERWSRTLGRASTSRSLSPPAASSTASCGSA